MRRWEAGSLRRKEQPVQRPGGETELDVWPAGPGLMGTRLSGETETADVLRRTLGRDLKVASRSLAIEVFFFF